MSTVLGTTESGVRTVPWIAAASGGAVGPVLEAEAGRTWLSRGFDVAEVERRRQAVVDRGRTQ